MFPLGRKHVNYGANIVQMELLGLLMVKSLMTALPKEELGEERCSSILDAFLSFFKVIVYWLQFGFKYEKTHCQS